MRIGVMHEARYSYDAPSTGVIQMLRLTPRNHAGQYVVDWRIDVSADCRLEPQEDAFGNLVHAFSTNGPLSELRLLVEGEVDTQDTAGIVKGAVERFPPSLYLRETALTRPDEAVTAYAAKLRAPPQAGADAGDGTLSTLHGLLGGIREDIAWNEARPSQDSTAAAVFAARHGTSRDLAHVFIAAARSLAIPARYVGGYLCGADGEGSTEAAAGHGLSQAQGAGTGAAAGTEWAIPADASQDLREDLSQAPSGDEPAGQVTAGHAWAEVHVPGLGWVGFDPANGICTTDRYIRVAVGLDSLGAAQVRGVHFGGSREAVEVKLAVISQAGWQTQG
jgi:transglutaminase-like putative cysteine protease